MMPGGRKKRIGFAAAFVPASSPALPHGQDSPSAGSAGLLGQAPDWMEREGMWPAGMRKLRRAGGGSSGGKGTLGWHRAVGVSLWEEQGACVPGGRLEGPAEAGSSAAA